MLRSRKSERGKLLIERQMRLRRRLSEGLLGRGLLMTGMVTGLLRLRLERKLTKRKNGLSFR